MPHGTCEKEVHFIKCLIRHFEPPWSHPHRHNEGHEIILVLRGEIHTQVSDQVTLGRPSDVLFRPQGLMHTPMAKGPEPLELIALRWRGGANLARLSYLDTRFDRNQRIRRQLDWILELHPGQDQANQGILDALTYSVIHELSRLQNPGRSDMTIRIRAHIRTHLDQRITLDDLAQEADMSKYHFSRMFKEATSQTPMELVNQMRIEKAQDLLLHTNLTLSAIAAQVGLVDASHLSHTFRRLTGRSPGSLRHNRTASARKMNSR